MPQPRVVMIQDGARRRYALPLALQRAGMLERMFTEGFVTPRSPEALAVRLLGLVRPAAAQRMAGRSCPEIEPRRVVRHRALVLRQALARRGHARAVGYYAWSAREVARWVLRRGFGQANALLGFVRNLDPLLCREARSRGLVAVGDQIIAPAAEEIAEGRRQARRWPGWQPAAPDEELAPYIPWERETWANLDCVTCMSEYVRDGLLAEGVPAEKIALLPYPFEAAGFACPDRRGLRGPVTVGFVGAINLRKGAPYFLETAARFDPARVRFVMIGRSELEPAVMERYRGKVELLGSLPRARVPAELERFDAFYFPSTCEGSAGAVMEAMAAGLPVVTTRNSGSLVRDGEEGFIVPVDDLDAHAERVERLVRDAELRHAMGQAGRRRVERFDFNWYSGELAALFRRLVERAGER